MNTCPHCGADRFPDNPDGKVRFWCGTVDGFRSPTCIVREPIFQELQAAKARIEALEMALLPFAQIGDIANDPDYTLWKRSVSAGSVRLARGVLEAKEMKP